MTAQSIARDINLKLLVLLFYFHGCVIMISHHNYSALFSSSISYILFLTDFRHFHNVFPTQTHLLPTLHLLLPRHMLLLLMLGTAVPSPSDTPTWTSPSHPGLQSQPPQRTWWSALELILNKQARLSKPMVHCLR